MAGKNLRYDQVDAKPRAKLDKSREAEWKKWMDFDAGILIQGELLEELLKDGVSMLPTQWIETDENEHLKRPGVEHEAVTKSRLVACGQHENREGLRTDSPTASVEALNLICSFAACKRLKIKSADIKNAYFNADPIHRLLLLKPPRSGLPGHWNQEKMAIVANRPIYGTADAGRGFYKKLRKCEKEAKLDETRQLLSLYTYNVEGKIELMLGAHVDDVIWAAAPEYESMIYEFLANFVIKKEMEGNFGFCGREYA
jgi:hypothetical protein